MLTRAVHERITGAHNIEATETLHVFRDFTMKKNWVVQYGPPKLLVSN
jgi:hypothetical protein